ncbi:hypothetical protein BJ170DRAFT_109559 [Xylariales sp. AK1849]|nr:hypothetical protein BJ170DRAFT_109559 [Xylariales sp. AK1849]
MDRPMHVQNRIQTFPYSTSCPANIDMATMDEQSECVFFTLPGEIRTSIFEYALTPDDDHTKQYLPDRVYTRPGQRFHPRTNISLLQTCKRIFQETRFMPVSQATHTFWVFGGPWKMMRTKLAGMAGWEPWQTSLSEEQRKAVQFVHIFAQQYVLESIGNVSTFRPLRFATKNLRLTFRRTDWWSWQSPAASSDRLGICPWLPGRVTHQAMLAQPLLIPRDKMRETMVEGTWGWQICQMQGLQKLEIEFEVDVIKKLQLQKVLERAEHWIFPLAGTNAVLAKSGEVTEMEWEGVADRQEDSRYALNATGRGLVPDMKKTYYVAMMTWKAVSESNEPYLVNTMVAD